MLFRRRPDVVEAVQYTGVNAAELVRFTRGKFHEITPDVPRADPQIVAEVLDVLSSTWVGVRAGDWIIKGTVGEFYPCADKVFTGIYEPVLPASIR